MDPDDKDYTYKLRFSDGQTPEVDWFGAGAVQLLDNESSEDQALGFACPAEETECALCMEDFKDECQAPCAHVFCRECILKAMEMNPPVWRGDCPLCRRPLSVYTLRDVSSGAALATPEFTTIFGLVFIQAGGIGVASYHFDAEDDCFISYRNAPDAWRLADGAELPAKKSFSQFSWNAESRLFHGVVEWDPPFGGNSRWDYEIFFAEDFSGVVDGKVLLDGGPREISFRAPWDEDLHKLSYLRWTPDPITVFGSVYVQGAFYSGLLEGVASYHFVSENSCYISYEKAPDAWRLDDGSAPPLKKPFLDASFDAQLRRFRGKVVWDVPFQGAARWEYELFFAEDYSRVVHGSLRSFSQDGGRPNEKTFVDPHDNRRQARVAGQLVYVRKPGVLMMAPQLLREMTG